jgi:hypothetical protein
MKDCISYNHVDGIQQPGDFIKKDIQGNIKILRVSPEAVCSRDDCISKLTHDDIISDKYKKEVYTSDTDSMLVILYK